MILSKVKKKVVFLTGTRADFGKLKSLISVLQSDSKFIVDVFVTGMHLQKKYGFTVNEIIEAGFKNIFKFKNFVNDPSMEVILANTIKGFSKYIKKNKPDLIVIHGDRVEALAGAIAGAINNVLVSHIEGGEVSGTIDESIRHAVSKFSHIHFTTDMYLCIGMFKSSHMVRAYNGTEAPPWSQHPLYLCVCVCMCVSACEYVCVLGVCVVCMWSVWLCVCCLCVVCV